MPRGRNRGSVLRRGQTYYIKYSLAGRQRWERVGASATEARKVLSRRLSEMDAGSVVMNPKLLFAELVERWRRDYLGSAQLKPSTVAAYDSILSKHLLPYFAALRLDQLTTHIVQRFVAEKLSGPEPLSPKTIRNCIRLLGNILKTAVKWNLVLRNVATDIELPRVPKREMDFLRPEEVRLLLNATQDESNRCVLLVAVASGLRQGELRALQWDDIDWARATIKVRRAFSRRELQTPKTASSSREVRLGTNVMDALRTHYERCGPRSVYVFSTAAGTPLDPSNLVKRVFEPALRRAGLRRIRWHDLRHSYASILINEGANLKFVSKQLGHSSIQITLDRYSHLMPERHDAIVARLDELLATENAHAVKPLST